MDKYSVAGDDESAAKNVWAGLTVIIALGKHTAAGGSPVSG